MGKLF